MDAISPSSLNTLPVITFENTSLGSTHAIVCDSPEAYANELERLRSMDHLKILFMGHAKVFTAADRSEYGRNSRG